MDKESRALRLAEDNAVEIAALRKKVFGGMKATILNGITNSGRTYFGRVRSSNGCIAIATFFGGTCSMMYDEQLVAGTSNTPIMAVLPRGDGMLRLGGSRTNSFALLIGADHTEQYIRET